MTDIDRSAPPPRLLSRPREFSVCRLCYKIGRSLVLASTASIKRPVLVPVSAHGSASDRNCALASTMRLTMPNRSRVLQAVNTRHRHHVAGGEVRAGWAVTLSLAPNVALRCQTARGCPAMRHQNASRRPQPPLWPENRRSRGPHLRDGRICTLWADSHLHLATHLCPSPLRKTQQRVSGP